MFQAFVCDAVTGAKLDTLPVSAFSWQKLLSAGGSGSVSIVLDGTHSRAQLDSLFRHWSRIFVLEYDGVVVYGGYLVSHSYAYGSDVVVVRLTDLWGMAARRLAIDGSVPNFEKWHRTRNVSLAQHAADALILARDTAPADPDPRMPVTIHGMGGTAVSRTWYGYHVNTVGDVWRMLMDEGLDIYFRPRWIGNGEFDWLMLAGPAWESGVTHEFFVTADASDVSEFSASYDGARITTNAVRLGEGSEQDMLIRSNRKLGGVYPRLDRVTPSKQSGSVPQLAAMASNDLLMYGSPTVQWEFRVPVSVGVDVGDLVRIHFDGDQVIPDGFSTRRVVSVSGDMSEFVTVAVQQFGGA